MGQRTIQSHRNYLTEYANQVLVLSNFLRRMILDTTNLPDTRVEVVYPVFPKTEIAPTQITHDKLRFTFLGALSFLKGIVNLLAAVILLIRQKKTTNFTLDIFGQGPLEALIKHIIEKENLGNHVTLNRSINHTMVPTILNQSDVIVVPSLTNEGLGRVAVEAMMLGKPVIVNNVGGLTEFITHLKTGFVTNAYDVTSLARCLNFVSSLSRNELEEIGLKARERVRGQIDNEAEVKKLIKIYEKLTY